MAIFYNPRTITDGLVLCLDAANTKSYPGSGTTWTDLSGGGNTGTLTNGPTYSSANGGSITFDGVNDYVSTNATVNYSSATWCCWFRTPATFTLDGAFSRRILYKSDNSGNNEYNFRIDASGNLTWSGYGATGYSYQLSTTVQTNTWYYIVGSYDVSNGYFYLNGSFVSSAAKSQSVGDVATIGLYLARVSFSDVGRFNGRIATTQIYNRALSAAEISQNFNATRSRYGI